MNRAIQFCLLVVLSFSFAALAVPQEKATRILVLKKEHKMELLSGDKIIRTYTVALGRGGLAPKQRQGDHLTPRGCTKSITETRTADSIVLFTFPTQTTPTGSVLVNLE